MKGIVFEELEPETRNSLVRATNAFFDRCFADPAHQDRLKAYKQKLIDQGRWPPPGCTGDAEVEVKEGEKSIERADETL